MFIDVHCHLTGEEYDAVGGIDEVLTRAIGAGVDRMICSGFDLQSSLRAKELAERYDFVYFCAGFHPSELDKYQGGDLEEIRKLCRHEKCVALGEIGLDYYWEDNAPRAVQLDWCRKQIELALELNLPIIFHDREAHEDTLTLLREYNPRGVLHCYSGSVEMMREVTALGLYIGLGGATTFKNARKPVEVAAAVPADRLLLETDAPYMAPVPMRGKRCDSSMIAHTAARIAEIRCVDVDTLLEQTRRNANILFGLDF